MRGSAGINPNRISPFMRTGAAMLFGRAGFLAVYFCECCGKNGFAFFHRYMVVPARAWATD